MSYIALDATDLALASLLVVLNGGLSLALQLGLARQLAIATLRMVVQLLLVGMVLEALFGIVSPFWTAFAAMAMLLFAGREVVARQERRLAGFWSYGLGTSCMLVAATLVTVFALWVQVNPDPWYHPRFALPLLGMVLGNTMTGVSLGLDTLTTFCRWPKALVWSLAANPRGADCGPGVARCVARLLLAGMGDSSRLETGAGAAANEAKERVPTQHAAWHER